MSILQRLKDKIGETDIAKQNRASRLQRLQELRQGEGQPTRAPAVLPPEDVQEFDELGAAELPQRGPASAPQQPVQQAIPAQQPVQQPVNPMSGMPVVPQAARQLEEAVSLEQEAVLKGAQAGAAQAQAESAYLQQVADQQEKMSEENLRKEMERQELVQERIQRLDQKMEEIASLEVDPNRIWESRSTGQKVMTGIGLFLGAFGAAGGGGNAAVRVINQAIEQDINAQKSNIQNRMAGAKEQRGLLQDLQNTFGNMRQAEEAARMAGYQNAQLRLQAIAGQYQAPQIQAQAQQLWAQLEQKKQEARVKFEQEAQVMAAEQQRQALIQGRLEGTAAGQQALSPAQSSAFIQTVIEDETERRKAREELGEVRAAQRVLDRVDKITVQENIAGVLDAAQAKKLRGEIAKELDLYMRSVQRTPAENADNVARIEAFVDSLQPGVTAEYIRDMVNNVVANLTSTPVLDGYNIRPELKFRAKSEPDPRSQFNPSQNRWIDEQAKRRGVSREQIINDLHILKSQ
jgi:hypothetical protein